MNVYDVCTRERSEKLDDSITPYLWSNADLIGYLNDTIDELADDTLLIKDQTTEATCQIKLLSNVGRYALPTGILHVRQARLTVMNTYAPLIRTTEDWLDGNVTDWRDETAMAPSHYAPGSEEGYLTVYPKFDTTYQYLGSSDISFTAATKRISQATANFAGLAEGDEVYISGTTNNNGYFTVVTASTTYFTVSETVVTEPLTSAIIRKVRDVLYLTVNRSLATVFTVADIAAVTTITGMRIAYTDALLNGMAKRAFLKPDSETYDKGKSTFFQGLFDLDKKRIRRKLILLNKPDRTMTIRSGQGLS